ncbi:poly-gamma-glutamate system protein, partial [SCandidatus Aminicenantes bacterium Aminicenantia_JdfR_composite]|nr:poly-gamma-glutamate system protein [SCandidatus Aminicenantes bacterium Aminicenantia_JdfR_composite]
MRRMYRKPLKNKKTIILLFSLSLIFFILTKYYSYREGSDYDMIKASEIMLRAMETIKNCRKVKGIPFDENVDINKTGLIGIKYSSITTSIGNLEAKRTTTNPNFAGLIIFLLKRIGIKNGDTIAVGASGSFPALIIAVLSASKVMNLKPLIIFSIGASQWGANIPEFNMLDIFDCLLKKRIFNVKPIAVSLGGEKDIG